MANAQNLRKLTSEQAREIGQKGGIASGASRRRKADLRKAMNDLLTNGIISINGENCTYEEAMCLSMVQEVIKHGNVAAYNAILNTLRSGEEQQERKARIAKIKAETDGIKKNQDNEQDKAESVVIIDDIGSQVK